MARFAKTAYDNWEKRVSHGGDLSGKGRRADRRRQWHRQRVRACVFAEAATVAILDRDFETAKRTAAELAGRAWLSTPMLPTARPSASRISAVMGRFGRIDAIHNTTPASPARRSLFTSCRTGMG